MAVKGEGVEGGGGRRRGRGGKRRGEKERWKKRGNDKEQEGEKEMVPHLVLKFALVCFVHLGGPHQQVLLLGHLGQLVLGPLQLLPAGGEVTVGPLQLSMELGNLCRRRRRVATCIWYWMGWQSNLVSDGAGELTLFH